MVRNGYAWIGESTETESQGVAAERWEWDEGRVTTKGDRGVLLDTGHALELNSNDDHRSSYNENQPCT